MALSGRAKLVLVALLVYWPTIFFVTHRPIPLWVYKAGVSDKTLHFTAYLILTFLFWFTVGIEERINWHKWRAWFVVLLLVFYALIDEWIQGYVGRNCNAADFFANLAGVFAGLILFSFVKFWPAFLVMTCTTIFLLTNLSRVNLADIIPVADATFHFFAYGVLTLVWAKNVRLFSFLPASRIKRLLLVFLLPLGLLFFAKVYSIIAGRGIVFRDILLAIISIVVSAAIFVLMKHSSIMRR